MSREEPSESAVTSEPVAVERVSPVARASWIDAWQALKKSFAFALAADDYETGWLDRLSKLTRRLRELTAQDADLALYMMLQTAMNEADHYSASHAMFSAVVADLCGRYFEWPEAEIVTVHNAALTMNVGMALMQDAMAQQHDPLSAAQRQRVDDHPTRSVEQLKRAGANDPLWLEIVRRHHRPIDEGESDDPLTPPQRLAQLLQRIDVFTAKLSRRKVRLGSNATVAARDACLNASGMPDAIGAAMLRVLGLYPPGSFVRLASGETGVVVKRGDKAHTPFVACVRRADGGVISQPVLRDSSSRLHAVQRSLSADEAKIRLNHERIIAARP